MRQFAVTFTIISSYYNDCVSVVLCNTLIFASVSLIKYALTIIKKLF